MITCPAAAGQTPRSACTPPSSMASSNCWWWRTATACTSVCCSVDEAVDCSVAGRSLGALGDDDATGAAKASADRESGSLGGLGRLAPSRAVAASGIDGQRAARSARVSDDEAGGRTSFMALVARSLAGVIVSAHAPGEAPRGIAAVDPTEHDCPVRNLGERGKGGARERAGEGNGAKSVHDVLPSCRRWTAGRPHLRRVSVLRQFPSEGDVGSKLSVRCK